MPWKLGNKIIREGRGWTDNAGTKHPYNWNIWSDADKKAAGLTWEDPPASESPYDNRFYHGRQADGTLIPKSLTDVKAVDDDNKAVIDPVTGKQLVTKGLKTVYIEQTKQTANNKLVSTDWYVTRKAEDSTTTIPSDVTTYRAAVRTKSDTIETAITNAADHAAFMALFNVPVDSDGNPTGNAPINDWPDEL
tara:strand:- start:91 stop:666 length:576 start_codon:yes stop_codon:yes gene_type:complete